LGAAVALGLTASNAAEAQVCFPGPSGVPGLSGPPSWYNNSGLFERRDLNEPRWAASPLTNFQNDPGNAATGEGGYRLIVDPSSLELSVSIQNKADTTPTGEDGVYQAPMYYDVVAKNAPNFTKDLSEAKEIGRITTDPMAALKDPLREKRVRAACLLITMYRTGRNGATKLEPIDAEESKLILSALALADWDQFARNDGVAIIGPGGIARNDGQDLMNAFNMLGVTEKDGWRQPQFIQTIQDLTSPMQQWLANNAATYRIQRIVTVNPGR